MARIALGITLAFLLVTCFFGFETHSKVADLADSLQSAKSSQAAAEQEAARDKAQLRTAQDDLGKAKSDLQASQAQLATVQSNLDSATSQVSALNDQIKTLQAQVATGGTSQVVSTPTGVPQDQYDKVNAQLKDAQAQIAELNEVKDTLNSKVHDAESRSDDLQKIVDHYKNGTLRNGLEGEVLAVNQGWNFVVLSIGDRAGAVANAEMILERDGSQIGKVRITSVEPSTSVADIIPG
jgi:chromosome segregation ATPase